MADSDYVNLLKLCVGADAVEDLIDWQDRRRAETPGWETCHVTRMWPKREAEVLAGGSLYWVFKGLVLARQRILRLDERRGQDGILRCAIILDPQVIRTEPQPRRPFQGWRYLDPAEAPRDLNVNREREDSLPPSLAAALAEIGVR
ncbi:DUF1489 family protein [Solirhodobacter olei]|uniref:DUF1489 family protein n=1 Tax=Solirhodobacter olei TaxID=2493082 RepID=UPI000FD73D0D|nr:DUF1489 domain-containing protein [Solirhodobacter olei]